MSLTNKSDCVGSPDGGDSVPTKCNKIITKEFVAQNFVDPKLCGHILTDLKESIDELDKSKLAYIEGVGRDIYRENPNMRDISEFMEHPATREFYNSHFNTWGDITSIMLYLKLYNLVDKMFDKYHKNSDNLELNGYHKIAITHQLMKNRDAKHVICSEMVDWMYSTAGLSNIDPNALNSLGSLNQISDEIPPSPLSQTPQNPE